MNGTGAGGSCWPTEQEELLLAAALRPKAEALAAWDGWCAAVDLKRAILRDHGLLPLVYRRLQSLGVAEASLVPLRSVYRREWYLNQLLLEQAAGLLRACERAGIQTLVLKGAALIAGYYLDVGVRPMQDIDLLVPPDQVGAAIQLLLDLGWTSKSPSPHRFVASRHARSFTDPAGHEVDLHWHALWECWSPGADAGFWSAAVPLTLGDTPTITLCPADQLLHACAHGVGWNERSPVRWVADAMVVMRSGLTEDDWRRLIAHTQTLGMTLPVREGLRYLRDRWGAPVPVAVLQTLDGVPVPRIQRLVYRARTRPPRRVLGYAPLVAYRYFLPGNGVRWSDLWRFPRYVQRYIGLEHLWQLPGYSAAWVGARLAKAQRGSAAVHSRGR